MHRTLLKVVAFIVVAAMIMPMGTVYAEPQINTNYILHDNFNDLSYATDDTAVADYWWVGLISEFPPFRTENQQCAGVSNPTATCLTIQTEGETSYAHFEMQPDPQGPFWLVQMGDARSAFSSAHDGKERRWLPEPGGKIIATSRVRFSEGYEADASGGAVGSTGVGFWNAPLYFLPDFPYVGSDPVKAIWNTYTEAPTFNGQFTGYTANVYDFGEAILDVPTQFEQLSGLDMSRWFTQQIVWESDESGNQEVTFNVVQLGEHLWDPIYFESVSYDLEEPLPSLNFVAWIDSSAVQIDNGTIISGVSAPTTTQWMDLDYVNIIELPYGIL